MSAPAAIPPAKPPPSAPPPLRREDWPDTLRRFLAARADRPFDWATNTCCHLAADWVYHMSGVAPARAFFAQSTSLLTAQRLLKKKGGVAGLVTRIAHKHHWPQVPPTYARRGDLVLFKDTAGLCAIGICTGETFAAVGPGGLTYRPMTQATHAFQIG